MIDFLRGKPVYVETDFAVLDVNGVGYRVFCPNPYAFSAKNDQEVTVFVYHHVREDAILLFGFATREEQRLFRRLLDVSGVGPKVALGVLAGAKPEAVVAAIQREDVVFLTKLPGIGKKTAQRMVLDLKDRLDGVGDFALAGAGAGGVALEDAGGDAGNGTVWSDAKAGLVSLGYTEAEADRALQAVKSKNAEADSVDVIIKLALQALFQLK
ncbi:Holliday junction branch migration protein RuvA [Paenibacillus turpanensis]|uniref:Holliday junction branch migration protein RuvA n=1 Tax=Paenibacillus turpanensis TaxID=2689078 RepID=UPI00140E6129|nr:Holliday junction branch migration protein RuvA [Paenibacillus turpanensis]